MADKKLRSIRNDMQNRWNITAQKQKRVIQRLSRSITEALETIGNHSDRPDSMAYFYRILKEAFDGNAYRNQHNEGKKIIGTYCVLVPEELIYAAGATPVRLCAGAYDTIELGEDFLPDISCPLVKSLIGFTMLSDFSFYRRCDTVVVPATCDWKVKMGEILREIVPVTMLDLPRMKERENARQFWLEEIWNYKKILEKLTGVCITRTRLLNAIRMIQRARAEFRRFQKIRKVDSAVIKGEDALAVMNAYFYDYAESWTRAVRQLNNELEQRITQGKTVCRASTPRILLTGSPIVFPNWKIPALIEETGGILVADECCTSGRFLHDMVAIDEHLFSDLMRAIAERYLLPCSCPIFSDNEDRKNRILQLATDFKVQGVVYHVLKGCHPYDMEVRMIEEAVKREGIPQLKIETDFSPEDIEQIRTRIEAFIETIKSRRK